MMHINRNGKTENAERVKCFKPNALFTPLTHGYRDEQIYEDSDCLDYTKRPQLEEGEDDYFSGPLFTATFWKLVGGVLLGLGLSVVYIYLLLR